MDRRSSTPGAAAPRQATAPRRSAAAPPNSRDYADKGRRGPSYGNTPIASGTRRCKFPHRHSARTCRTGWLPHSASRRSLVCRAIARSGSGRTLAAGTGTCGGKAARCSPDFGWAHSSRASRRRSRRSSSPVACSKPYRAHGNSTFVLARRPYDCPCRRPSLYRTPQNTRGGCGCRPHEASRGVFGFYQRDK
jgi:hypothetical protein